MGKGDTSRWLSIDFLYYSRSNYARDGNFQAEAANAGCAHPESKALAQPTTGWG